MGVQLELQPHKENISTVYLGINDNPYYKNYYKMYTKDTIFIRENPKLTVKTEKNRDDVLGRETQKIK